MNLQVAFRASDRHVQVQAQGAALPAGHSNIGTFTHPDPVYPGSLVLVHGVRDLLYKRKPDGTPGFFPDNITDLESIEIEVDAAVYPTAVQAVKITSGSFSMNAEDDPVQLELLFTPANATNKAVTYVSSTPAVATVSNAGLVTFVGVGTTTITVTSTDGSHTDSIDVTGLAA